LLEIKNKKLNDIKGIIDNMPIISINKCDFLEKNKKINKFNYQKNNLKLPELEMNKENNSEHKKNKS
jgi:hypothetical protein